MEIIRGIEQGSQEWLDLRLGIITCSEISRIRADGAGAKTYVDELAYERITGLSSSIFSGNQWTERGSELEHEARSAYELKTGLSVEQVTIVLNKGFGYSPDGLVTDVVGGKLHYRGAIEIKVKKPSDQIKILRTGEIPKIHLDQIHGGISCAELYFMDFVSYCENLPLFVKRVYRSDVLDKIDQIDLLVEKYNQEIDLVVSEIGEMF